MKIKKNHGQRKKSNLYRTVVSASVAVTLNTSSFVLKSRCMDSSCARGRLVIRGAFRFLFTFMVTEARCVCVLGGEPPSRTTTWNCGKYQAIAKPAVYIMLTNYSSLRSSHTDLSRSPREATYNRQLT